MEKDMYIPEALDWVTWLLIAITLAILINRIYLHFKTYGMSRLPRHERHTHFWIQDKVLHESYTTERGMRSMPIMSVPDFEDTDDCDAECLAKIEEICHK